MSALAPLSLRDFPALEGRVVTEAHVAVCRARGCASHTIDGVPSGSCPRCGEVVPSAGSAPLPVVTAELSGGARVLVVLPAHLGGLLREPVVLAEGPVLAVLFLPVDDEKVRFLGALPVARAAVEAWPAQLCDALLPPAVAPSGPIAPAFGPGVRVCVRVSAL